jgi:hypothetical protein
MLNVLLLMFLLTSAHADDTIIYDVVSHAEIADGRPSGMQKGFIRSYETHYGYSVSLGDLISVHVPGGIASNTVVVGAGGAGSIMGGGVAAATTVTSQYFQYVYNGTYMATVAKAALAGIGGTSDPTIFMAPASLSGSEIRVTRIKLAGTKRRPVIWMECELVNAKDKANLSGVITISDYDSAIRLNEVYNSRFVTRDIAIAKIREAKSLLDLGVYTSEQFEEVRTQYMPFISPE